MSVLSLFQQINKSIKTHLYGAICLHSSGVRHLYLNLSQANQRHIFNYWANCRRVEITGLILVRNVTRYEQSQTAEFLWHSLTVTTYYCSVHYILFMFFTLFIYFSLA